MEPPSAPRRRGRPRVVTHEAVLDAARELGLEQLSVAAVAERLGVARVSVHRLVGSREDLETLLGEDIIASAPVLHDTGQAVDVYLLQFARNLRGLIRAHPGLAGYYARGFPRTARSARRMETSIQALGARGIPPGPAARLASGVASLAIADAEYHLRREHHRLADPAVEGPVLTVDEFPGIHAASSAVEWENWPEWTMRAAIRGLVEETLEGL